MSQIKNARGKFMEVNHLHGAEIKKLWAEGYNSVEIGKKLGRADNSVRNILYRIWPTKAERDAVHAEGKRLRKIQEVKWKDEVIEAAVGMYRTSLYSHTEIAAVLNKEFGIEATAAGVAHQLKKLGHTKAAGTRTHNPWGM
jgi:transposase